MTKDARDQLIVALDVGGIDPARAMVDTLGDQVHWYKVGLELFSAAGPEAVTMLKQKGKRVFLDLKLHDIPNTVARTVSQLAGLGVDLVDIHVACGREAMARAASALREVGDAQRRPRLLGVTVLTSTARLGADQKPLSSESLAKVAMERAISARQAGLDGVVVPAPAVRGIRGQCGEDFLMLVPGIRPKGSARADQRWVATPSSAIAAGARWIVVGRPITASPQPPAAVGSILAEIAAAARRV